MLSGYTCRGRKLVVSSAIQPVMTRSRLGPCCSTDASLFRSQGPVKPQYAGCTRGCEGKCAHALTKTASATGRMKPLRLRRTANACEHAKLLVLERSTSQTPAP